MSAGQTKPTTHNRYPDRTNFVLRVIAHQFWANLPREVQFLLSRLQSYCFKIKSSRFLIRPYCYFQYDSGFSRGAYASASGNPKYQSFQDFFSRRLALKTEAMTVPTWPCDGLIADAGPIDELSMVAVKGEPMSVRAIFGCAGEAIPDHYFFTNIFLHNRDYHRIHAPMLGFISRIEHIPGDLRLLRPWAYKRNPSLPALTNERVNIDITDKVGQVWYLSIVGGPGVATIQLEERIKLQAEVNAGENLAVFLLGSTCCMAGPFSTKNAVKCRVNVGTPI